MAKNPLYVHFYVHNTMLGNARPVNRPGGYQTAPSSPKRTYTHHCKPAAPSPCGFPSLCWWHPSAGVGDSARAEVSCSNKAGLGWQAAKPGKTIVRLTGSAPGTTLPGMSSASMVFLATVASESGVRHRRISLPLIPDLVDGRKYFLPGDLPPAAGEELRAMCRPKPGKVLAARPLKSADRQPGRPRSGRTFEDELVRTLGSPV